MWISLIADGVIAALLGVTIFYCTLVNRRLAALRSGKDELKKVVEDLTVATTSAQMNIERLKEAGKEVVFTLEDDVRKGRALSDELSLMIEAGNNLANRLEGGRERASGMTKVPSENDGLQAHIGSADAPQPQGDGGSSVRARVQVQSDTNRPNPGATPKSALKENVMENELLKALRRAR